MIPKWMKGLKIEMLTSPYRELAMKIGIDHALIVADEFGGMTYYFKKIEPSLRHLRNEMIQKEFDGFNYRDLARKYDLTETQIRRIADGRSCQPVTIEP